MKKVAQYKKELFKNGFVHIKGLMAGNDLALVNEAINSIRANPSPFNITKLDEAGEFFMDFNNWRRIPTAEQVCKLPNLVDLAVEIAGSNKCWLMHEDVVVKAGTAGAQTPIHHDRPYFIFKGDLNLSVWITAENVPRDSSLTCYCGTHLLDKLFLPKVFKTGENMDGTPEGYEEIGDATFANHKMVDFELSAGDAVVFFHKTIHGSHQHSSSVPRRTFVVRYLLDGASLTKSYYNNVPPYEKMGVKIVEDGPVPEEFFPLLRG